MFRAAIAVALVLATAASAANYATATEQPRPKTRVMGSRPTGDVRIGPRVLSTREGVGEKSALAYEGTVGPTILTYFGARYYDSRRARWLSTDPALGAYLGSERLAAHQLLPAFLNNYAYGNLNPLTVRDGDGRVAPIVWFAIALVAVLTFRDDTPSGATSFAVGSAGAVCSTNPVCSAGASGFFIGKGVGEGSRAVEAYQEGRTREAQDRADTAALDLISGGLFAVGARAQEPLTGRGAGQASQANVKTPAAALPPSGGKLLGQAIGKLRGMSGAERAGAFRNMAGDITKATQGQWNAQEFSATNGTVFAGEGGEALVFDSAGKMFRGQLANRTQFTLSEQGVTVNYGALKPLE